MGTVANPKATLPLAYAARLKLASVLQMSREEHLQHLQQWHTSRAVDQKSAPAALSSQEQGASRLSQQPEQSCPQHHCAGCSSVEHDSCTLACAVAPHACRQFEGTGYEQLVAHVAASIIQHHWQRHKHKSGSGTSEQSRTLRSKSLSFAAHQQVDVPVATAGKQRLDSTGAGALPALRSSEAIHGHADNVDSMLARYRTSEAPARQDALEYAEALLCAAGLSPQPGCALPRAYALQTLRHTLPGLVHLS